MPKWQARVKKRPQKNANFSGGGGQSTHITSANFQFQFTN